jgi:hypothetical protein
MLRISGSVLSPPLVVSQQAQEKNLLRTVTDLARDSSFGTAIRYKVQGPGIEPR